MSDDHKVLFKLNGKRPSDFTIDRLAKYLSTLGELVGSPGKVRVKKLTPGSVKIELSIDHAHYPVFVQRLTSARDTSRSALSTRKAVETLKTMITDDQVTAEMLSGKTKLIYLRGYQRGDGPAIGPVVQRYKVRGVINRLEGKDDTKHVGIAEFATKREVRAEFRDSLLASKLQKLLWGPVVELSGIARLFRHPNGDWEVKSFRIDTVEELDDAPPSSVVQKLRSIFSDIDLGADPVADFKQLRG